MFIVLSDKQVQESINCISDIQLAKARKAHLENLSMDNIHIYELVEVG